MTTPTERLSMNANIDLRRRGRSVVERWFALNWAAPEDAEDFIALFSTSGRLERHFRPEGRQQYIGDSLRAHYQSAHHEFSNWSWLERRVYATQYPQVFWALAEGRGLRKGSNMAYENAFAMLFVIDGDRIRILREWSDPIRVLESQGVHVPDMPSAPE